MQISFQWIALWSGGPGVTALGFAALPVDRIGDGEDSWRRYEARLLIGETFPLGVSPKDGRKRFTAFASVLSHRWA